MSGSEAEWFADEAFWRETYSFMFPDTRLAAAPSEVEQIITWRGAMQGTCWTSPAVQDDTVSPLRDAASG
jgi:hypothetical protein